MIALASTAGAATGDSIKGDLSEAQIMTIKMLTIARYAGTNDICPDFRFNEAASLKMMADNGIRPEMVTLAEYKGVVAEAILGATERHRANAVDFCEANWQLFGPGGRLRWQMLEAN